MKLPLPFIFLLAAFAFPLRLKAQEKPAAGAPDSLNLEQCITFALQNRPAVQQAFIDEQIAEREIKASLADWYPQVSMNGNLQHYLKMPITIFPDENGVLVPRTIGTQNSSTLSLLADQAIFDQDVIFASRGSRYVRRRSEQQIRDEQINTIVVVTRAFYDVLLTREQLNILRQTIIRQEKQLKDAYAQYENGLVDKTDFQRADISLTNTRSNFKRLQESVNAKKAYLKEVMGYPAEKELHITFDRDKLQQSMFTDTAITVTYANRIEYQQLQTQKQIQELTVNYYKWNFLPTLSGFANYNLAYLNNDFQELYQQSYPNSLIGLRVSMPLFQGTRRIQNLRRAELQQKRLDLDIANTKSRINTEYEEAMSVYKSEVYELNNLKKNVATAEDVYRIIKLQYDEGIKPYLDLILADAELRATQLNYLNALFRVLISKVALERATGTIDVNAYQPK